MRKTNWLVLSVVMLGLVCASSAGYAKDRMKGKDGKGCAAGKCIPKGLDGQFMHKAHFVMMNAKELGLSDKQESQVKDLKLKIKKEMIQLDAAIETIGVDVKANLMEKKIDVAATGKLIDKKYDVKKQKAKVAVQALADLKAILTDNQCDKMKDMMKDMKADMHQGMKKMKKK